jgi:lipopolysaccharide biosynthesis glycosyltransferase
LHFHILHSDIPQQAIQKIISLKKRYSGESHFIIHHLNRNHFDHFPEVNHLTLEAYYRLKMHDIFSNLNKVIYIDVDTIVLKPIRDLWNINLEGHPIGAVEITTGMSKLYDELGIHSSVHFNSGVMVCDLEKFRKLPLDQLYSEHIKNFKIIAADQDVLNNIFANNVYIIPLKWNLTNSVYRYNIQYRQYSVEELRLAMIDPSVIHFNGKRKPWVFKADRHMHSHQYWKYLSMTPWKYMLWKKYVKSAIVKKHKISKDSAYWKLICSQNG